MSAAANTVVRFAKTPAPGPLTRDVLAYEQQPMPAIDDGEILLRTIYLSIDAGSRAQLDDRASYVTKASIGAVPRCSGCVGEVVASRHPRWQAGDRVATTYAHFQSHQVIDPNRQLLFKLDPADGPLAMHIGALGMVGFTAYVGIFEVGRPQAGETVLVSAAAGATGALAGQFAKIAGARVVGIAGGAQKCAFVKNELGFDNCIDYKSGDLRSAIKNTCPNGIDVYYDNVGGDIQKAAFEQLNDFARVAICGMVGQYSGEGEAPGPNLMFTVIKRVTIRGFLASDHWGLFDKFRDDAMRWYQQGRLQHRATITQGLDNLHEAINSLATGKNIGKQLCQVGPE